MASFCLEMFPILCSMWMILVRDVLNLWVVLCPLKACLILGESGVGLVAKVLIPIVLAVKMPFVGITVLLYWIRWVIRLRVC